MINSRSLDDLQPFVRQLAELFIEKLDEAVANDEFPHYVVSQTLRDTEYQNSLYAKGRTKPGKIVTNAKGGTSYHEYGVALDVLLYNEARNAPLDDDDPRWDRLGEIGKECGFDWGGEIIPGIVDKPHFQYTAGLKIRDLKNGATIDEDGNAVSPGA